MATPQRQLSRSRSSGADLLCCAVCMERFDEGTHQAKLLPCHHSFCKDCLLHLLGTNQYLDCPSCRQRIHLGGPRGISGLQTNFYIAQMREILQDQPQSRLNVCRKHGNLQHTYFCRSCEVPICEMCRNTTHRENGGHIVLLLNTAITEYQERINVAITNARETMQAHSKVVRSLEVEADNLFAAKMQAEMEVNRKFDEYLDLINKRRLQLLEHLRDLYRYKREQLIGQIEDMGRQMESLSSLVDMCEHASHEDSILDMLTLQTKLESRTSDCVTSKLNPDLGCNFITFDPEDEQLMDLIQDLGSLQCQSAFPRNIKLTEPIQTTAGLFSSVQVSYTPAKTGDDSVKPVTVKVVDVYDDELPCSIRSLGEGSLEAMFRPQVSGIHILQAQFLGHPVTGARCTIHVQSNNPVGRIGEKGFGPGEMDFPRAVAVDKEDNLYVVDTGNSRIQKYDRNGQFLFHFPVAQRDRLSTCGIAVDPLQGSIICPEVYMQDADVSQADTLLFYSLQGELKHRLIYKDAFKKALSLALTSTGQIIAADYELNVITVLDSQGKVVRRFGGPGGEPGQFNHPTFVCVGPDDSIIIADADNHRIQVFDLSGKFLLQFGTRGSGKGEFLMPFGVAADQHGHILVVDGGNKRVQVFTSGGDFMSSIESKDDRMSAPRGLAVTSDGYALVADRDNHCVKKFRYLHSTLT